MSIHIQLDRQHAHYTNLDYLSGKVILTLIRDEAISAINVKLECESRTRLAAIRPDGKQQTELEVHKLLYKISKVFPTQDLLDGPVRSGSYTLAPGQHVYPFQFKMPFQNSCLPVNSVLTSMNLLSPTMEIARNASEHVTKALPPSLSGFPGEAEIKYFVKVTAQRPAFYKENFRAVVDIKFFPIEPIRPEPNKRESYARRQHTFSPYAPKMSKPGLFRRQSEPMKGGGPPPQISVDCRLPDPAIITCNEPVPLRILVKKVNDTTERLYLKLIHIELIGYTRVRAHVLNRKETSAWTVLSLANLNIPLGTSGTPGEKDLEIDNSLWRGIPLPNTVPPTFETCNLSRWYELHVKVGLSFGTPDYIKPELTVQPLRMPVLVYSGIRPPPELISKVTFQQAQAAAMSATVANTQNFPRRKPVVPNNLRPASFSQPSSSQVPAAATSDPRLGSVDDGATPVPPGVDPDEPPPSYDDAMADDLGPVDGPRRDYEQPVSQPVGGDGDTGSGSAGDRKGLGRMGSERLFGERS